MENKIKSDTSYNIESTRIFRVGVNENSIIFMPIQLANKKWTFIEIDIESNTIINDYPRIYKSQEDTEQDIIEYIKETFV